MLKTGKRYTTVIQQHHSFHTISSEHCVLLKVVLNDIVPPIPSNVAQTITDFTSQKTKHTIDQKMMRAARVPRAQSSLNTSGIVFRPRILSPATSGKSCAWIVVIITAAVRTIQWMSTALRPTSLLDPIRVVTAPQPKQARAAAFTRLRCSGPEPAQSRSLYNQTRVMKVALGSRLCNFALIRRAAGMRTFKICCASSADNRPEGIGRQGLLIMSSAIASGSLWLEISSASRCIHSQKTINGIRLSVRPRLNSYGAVSTKLTLEKTTEMARMDCGTMMHLKSPSVKKYNVLRLYQMLLRLSY